MYLLSFFVSLIKLLHRFRVYLLVSCVALTVIFIQLNDLLLRLSDYSKNYSVRNFDSSMSANETIQALLDSRNLFNDIDQIAQIAQMAKFVHDDVSADNSRFVDFVRTLVHFPSNERQIAKNVDLNADQKEILLEIDLDTKKNGFFIEYVDKNKSVDEMRDNNEEFTDFPFYLEVKRNWTGLVIEPTSGFNHSILNNHHVYSINACLHTNKPYIHKQKIFSLHETKTNYMLVPCIPLLSILQAIHINTVDYLSIESDRNLWEIISSLPFNQIVFKIIRIKANLNQEAKILVQDKLGSKKFSFVLAKSGDYFFKKHDITL
jgi:hypothetical protein